MEIRRLTNADAVEASRIYALSWQEAYRGIVPQEFLDRIPLDRWVPYLCDPNNKSYVLTDGGRMVATASAAKARDSALEGWMEIISIYALPEYFHQGYGKRLFSYMVNELIAQGCNRIYLWVLEENMHARGFYERNQFVPTEDRCTLTLGGKELTEIRYVYQPQS